MPQTATICLLCLSSLLAFLLTLSPLALGYSPQIIALALIIFFLLRRRFLYLLLAFVVSFVIFSTQGLNSPLFFLIYFLLFALAFQHPPSTTLAYSLFLILILSFSLNSLTSLLSLISLLFITPLAYFIGQQYLQNLRLEQSLSQDESDIYLWLALKFKHHLSRILDISRRQILSHPNSPQNLPLKQIKHHARTLLSSSRKLARAINQNDNETDNHQ